MQRLLHLLGCDDGDVVTASLNLLVNLGSRGPKSSSHGRSLVHNNPKLRSRLDSLIQGWGPGLSMVACCCSELTQVRSVSVRVSLHSLAATRYSVCRAHAYYTLVLYA